MKSMYKFKTVAGLETLVTRLSSGKEVAALILPSQTEEVSSATRLCIAPDTGISNSKCVSEFVKTSTVEEMNSPVFRRAAVENLRILNTIRKDGIEAYISTVANWALECPQKFIRIHFGGDFTLVNKEVFQGLLQALALITEKSFYLRTSVSTIVNDISLTAPELIPDNVVIGVEQQQAAELPLHNCCTIIFTDDEDACDDLTTFPDKSTKELYIKITDECKLCATTGKPWWSRLVTKVTTKKNENNKRIRKSIT